VDARKPATVSGPEKPPERTIAEWYSDKPNEHEGTAGAPAEAIRQAAQGAERAIEQQQVPARYQDLVRRRLQALRGAGSPAEVTWRGKNKRAPSTTAIPSPRNQVLRSMNPIQNMGAPIPTEKSHTRSLSRVGPDRPSRVGITQSQT
jgi:hypothetical protein